MLNIKSKFRQNMINKDSIKEIILEYQRIIPKIELIERDIKVESLPNYVFIGLRRAGKSFMMFADIQKRLSHDKAKIEDMLYINFEDERLMEMDTADLTLILDCYQEMFDNPQPYIYLDEIQNINGWEKYVRRLSDSGRHVWVTGSNAKMLSRDIATTLGGRFIIKYIPTFSFNEYLKFNKINISCNRQYDRAETIMLKRFLEEYFRYGGFAETFNLIEKREWTNSLYQKILFGDVIARNGYRNDRAIALLTRKLAKSVKQPSTQTRLLNIIKSTGAQISRNTISDYIESLDNSYITFPVYNYRHSLAERVNESKRYFSDNGILNLFLTDPNTSLIENLVAIEVMKRFHYERGETVYYYRNGIEVDFYIPESKLAIQVAYSIIDSETLQRETDAIIKLSKVAEVREAYIITYDSSEQTIVKDRFTIRTLTLLDFLLKTNRI